jgi:RND superfamily putative drug exporter
VLNRKGDAVRGADGNPAGVRDGRQPGGAGAVANADRRAFARLGRAVVRHPWRVITLWVLAVVAVVATSPGLAATNDVSSFLPRGYESVRAADLQATAFPQAGHEAGTAAASIPAAPSPRSSSSCCSASAPTTSCS